jgi:hypothetical protein
MFEFNEHSIPALPTAVETIEFAPTPTSVAELAEIRTDAVVLTEMLSKTSVTRLLLIST